MATHLFQVLNSQSWRREELLWSELENLNQTSFSCTAEFSFYTGLTCQKGTFSRWSPRWKLNATVSILFVNFVCQFCLYFSYYQSTGKLCVIWKKRLAWRASHICSAATFSTFFSKCAGQSNAHYRKCKFQLVSLQDISSWIIFNKLPRCACKVQFQLLAKPWIKVKY